MGEVERSNKIGSGQAPATASWQHFKIDGVCKAIPRSFEAENGRAVKKDPELTVKDFMTPYKKMKTWLLVVIIVPGAYLPAFLIFAIAYRGGFNK